MCSFREIPSLTGTNQSIEPLAGRVDPPAFNLRNDLMVAKHVHATVMTRLHQYVRDTSRAQAERLNIDATLKEVVRIKEELHLTGITLTDNDNRIYSGSRRTQISRLGLQRSSGPQGMERVSPRSVSARFPRISPSGCASEWTFT